jgi:hypothetical protein
LKESASLPTVLETNRSSVPSKVQQKGSKMKEVAAKNKVYSFEKPKELKAVFEGQSGALIIWLEAKVEVKFEILENTNKKSKN